jgi:hypothetical protein
MTGVPPSARPKFQVKPILFVSVITALFERDKGASGLVSITAPPPAVEAYELPKTFVAII